MRLGTLSAAALAASGLAIALMPEKSLLQLELTPDSPRGIAETRAGLGGTFAALGLWALVRGTSDAYTAVGMTWLGAAAFRTYSLKADEPETKPSFWAYLTGETVLGAAGILARSRRKA
ncbi:MAG: hypothetical protein QOD70_1160 [Frankiales bacterium]|jgi:hypothetical protein|nr:hypothetical protein [Frankiales bacterium]MDX6266420.1 hypothetical protein [Frankiales bacterium]